MRMIYDKGEGACQGGGSGTPPPPSPFSPKGFFVPPLLLSGERAPPPPKGGHVLCLESTKSHQMKSNFQIGVA